ncbi:MAG TPA: ABC transporter permease [Candidatus Dormibacteraeota bacterium]|nr:ABC transporter permease [Candidatus Dormibacteraeota bacterium]
MRPVLTQIRAAVLRRRTQTATVVLVSLLATTVSTMALTLLVRSTQPFDDAFARVNGPHLMFHLDAARVTPEQLQATSTLPGVTAAGSPHEIALVPLQRGEEKAVFEIVGRATPGGAVDRITLRDGRWPERPGEIVLSYRGDLPALNHVTVGTHVRAVSRTGLIPFTVVGTALDVGDSMYENSIGVARAWVQPGQVAPLTDGDQVRLGYEMAYRFQRAATTDELAADRHVVEAALPPNSQLWRVTDWLSMRAGSVWLVTLLSSVILAFSVFALAAVAVVVASVVAGAVLSSYREIGIIKALGFTPREIVAIFIGQMVLPALAGAVVGIPAGALASAPILKDVASETGLPNQGFIDPVADVTIFLGTVVLVVMAALIPAIRAARTDSVRAISMGSAPAASRRSRLAGVLSWLGAPRPLSLGAGDAFARPARAILTLIALAIGIATLVFAFAFQKTLGELAGNRASYGYAQDVDVYRYPAFGDADLSALLAAQPETSSVVATRFLHVDVPGAADPAPLVGMRGDAPGLGYSARTGRWFANPGEAVVAALTARDAHLRLGDRITVTLEGKSLTLQVVGVLDDFSLNGRGFRVGWETLSAVQPAVSPNDYLVRLRAGSDAKAFAKRITASRPESLNVTATDVNQINFYTDLINGMVGGLTIVLVLVASAGVFNATLLSTRERSHDIATLKAVGMTARQIALMVGGTALVLAVTASVVGVPLGMLLTGAIFSAMFEFVGVIVDPSGTFGPGTLLLVFGAAVAVALAGSALPARWAATASVAEVLRSE